MFIGLRLFEIAVFLYLSLFWINHTTTTLTTNANHTTITTTTKPRHLNNHRILPRHTVARGLAFDEGKQVPSPPPPNEWRCHGGFHPAREEEEYRGGASVADLAGRPFLLEVSSMFWKEGRELRGGGAL